MGSFSSVSRIEFAHRYAVGHISDGGSGSAMAYQPTAEQHIVRLEPHIPGMDVGAAAAPSPDLGDRLARRAATKRCPQPPCSTCPPVHLGPSAWQHGVLLAACVASQHPRLAPGCQSSRLGTRFG